MLSRHCVWLLGVLAPAAFAHEPFCECTALNDTQIRCVGGFSDGSAAAGKVLDVIADDERILLATHLQADSSVTFERPSEPFYVLFDTGPGHVVEIDESDIRR